MPSGDVWHHPDASTSARTSGGEAVKPQRATQPTGIVKPGRDVFSGKVYVLEKNTLKQISVTLGITDNRNTEIVGGELKAGDQIVIGDAQTSNKSKVSSSRPPMRMF